MWLMKDQDNFYQLFMFKFSIKQKLPRLPKNGIIFNDLICLTFQDLYFVTACLLLCDSLSIIL